MENDLWQPLKLEDLKVGDILEWDTSARGGLNLEKTRREGTVMRNDPGWLYVGSYHTPRQQDWLNNPHVKVRLKNE